MWLGFFVQLLLSILMFVEGINKLGEMTIVFQYVNVFLYF